MGQQQLLLIVLGVIIVGIAVVVGINVFTASSLQANNNAVIADLQTIGSMAQQYYRKPTAMGGGGNSFSNWEIPKSLEKTANMGAKTTAAVTANDVTLTATGTEKNSVGTSLEVKLKIWADSMKVTSTNVND